MSKNVRDQELDSLECCAGIVMHYHWFLTPLKLRILRYFTDLWQNLFIDLLYEIGDTILETCP